ncbi:MAG: hypothetical protein UT94_C0024G0004 [Candidatus Uhrbacteria bacterium GW2011_GWF2_40_263]|nr:MAG: hypothetical protein UT94_C0024G0004 [Candidatus Uhrbacteria bacterium GW2011_GWF2_40_263]
MEIMSDIDNIQKGIEGMPIVEKILHIKKYFEDTPVESWQMDKVTDSMMILSSLLFNLGDLKDYAYTKAEALSEEYKSSVRDKYIELKNGDKITDGMAKAMAEKECDEIKQMEIKANYQARKLRGLYENADRTINYSQSKIKTLIDSRVRSNMSGT